MFQEIQDIFKDWLRDEKLQEILKNSTNLSNEKFLGKFYYFFAIELIKIVIFKASGPEKVSTASETSERKK